MRNKLNNRHKIIQLASKTAFADVPAKLKDQVREILIESGFEYLAVEEVAE